MVRLTESLLASTLTPEKPSNQTLIGVHLQEFQPIPALKSTFKKSSTTTNCLAIHPTHIFAAQADKAVVNIYSRERNNQEAIVPFPEKIHSIVLAGESDGAGALILGTEGGRLILWELATGRQVSTPQHHLQRITCLAVDPTSNFLLSGSTDSTIHVWSVPGLLSFSASVANGFGNDLPYSPLRSLSNHRAAVTALAMGHSFSRNNIAVSASRDDTCIVWNHNSGDLLHTFLLPASPLCLALDPADRAVYVGYEDGSIQFINFYSQGGLVQQLHNPEDTATPSQPPSSTRWSIMNQADSTALSLQMSYDGTILLSGHENGKIHTWDVAAGRYSDQLADFSAAITNMHILKPTGFTKVQQPAVKLHHVIKPRYESFANGHHGIADAIPPNYTFTSQFTSNLQLDNSLRGYSSHEAVTHSSFPHTLIDEALSEFTAWHSQSKAAPDSSELADLRAKNATLLSQLEDAAESNQSVLAQVQQRDKQDWRRQKDDAIKAARKKKRRLSRMKAADSTRKKEMGEGLDDDYEAMVEEVEDKRDLSSSTDELTDSP